MTFQCRLGRGLVRAFPKRILAIGLGVFLAFATLAGAQAPRPKSGVHSYPARGVKRNRETLILKSAADLVFHGGAVITSAHVVFIFWGPSFNDAASPDYSYARTLQSFRSQFGTAPEYNTITQYSGSNGTIALTDLAAGTPDWFDTSTPPANVTDDLAQGKVNTYLSTHGSTRTRSMRSSCRAARIRHRQPLEARRAAGRPSGTALIMVITRAAPTS